MNKSSIKVMLLGISMILLSSVFSSTRTFYSEITSLALGFFGFVVVLSGFFSRD